VTLQDLEDLVVQGKQIEVRDSKTGDDLTRLILTQILIERHPEKMEMFPVAMLHGILRANDVVLAFLRTYLRQSLVLLDSLQQATPPLRLLSPLDWMRAFVPGGAPVTSERTAGSAAPAAPVEALAQRISELEARIGQRAAPEVESSPAGSTVPATSGQTAEEENRILDRIEARLQQLESQAASKPRRQRRKAPVT
jgi:polyhydroxyalkanoate synthesis repressor PhaR